MQTGDPAEPFTLPSTAGGEWSLQATLQSGKRAVLAFFPAAFTGG